MATYTIVAASKTKDVQLQHGTFEDIALQLRDESGEVKSASWLKKPGSPLPQEGERVEFELTQTQYGLKAKKPQGQGGGGFGGGGRRDSPETRRSIAMQSAQARAVDALRVAAEFGPYEPPNGAEVAKHVQAIAKALYLQVMAAEADQIKYGSPA